MSKPIFPTLVPAFHQHSIKSMLGSKIDVFLHILRVGCMSSMRLCLRVVGLAQLDGTEVIRVGPMATIRNHVPPHTDIFGWLNPRSISDFARLIQVQCHAGSKNVLTTPTYNNRAPRTHTRSLHPSLVALSVRSEPRLEGLGAFSVVEVHRSIVQTSSLMQIDIKSRIGLQHQCRLHTSLAHRSL